jgi:3-oxoacyl-[acyl-carrier protein] reductase
LQASGNSWRFIAVSNNNFGRLDGKVAIVTGSGKGIGEAIAYRFSSLGARVVINARSADDVERVTAELTKQGAEAYGIIADIGAVDGVTALIAGTVDLCGGIDILVHNAGIFPYAPIETMDDASWQQVIEINLSSAFRLSKACLPVMRERGSGRILFTSSIQGNRAAVPGCAHYAASKAGLNGFIKSAALEFARDGITVNGVEPGLTLTSGVEQAISAERRDKMAQSVPLGRWGSVQDVAAAMSFLASDEAGYITGQTLVIDGGATLPVFVS